MRIVFMGTPEIAACSLKALLADGHEVAGVYTRADKPVGRKQVLTQSPVKQLALQNGIPVFQPATLRAPGSAEQLAQLAPALVVVVAYGRLLPQDVLDVPTLGCINLHGSLLPKYRGAAPIQWAVINGDKETGLTVMQMDAGMDTGPVIAEERVGIPPNATAGEMFELMAPIGARLLCRVVGELEMGSMEPVPQGPGSTVAPQLTKEIAKLDFSFSAARLHNLVRGANPWPLAWFAFGSKKVKVERSRIAEPFGGSEETQGEAGEILLTNPLTVRCGEGALVLERVVPEGARPMTGAEWSAGRRFKAGQSLQL